MTMAVPPTPILSLRNVTKRFGPVTAIDNLSLEVMTNEVLGLVGDNGAGKSTLLSLLTGYNRIDSGEFICRGRPVKVVSPSVSRSDLSIEMIYQDLAVAPDLTVWQNLFLGQEHRRGVALLDKTSMQRRAQEVMGELNSKIRANQLVGSLSGGERQLVAVARALLFDRDIILMDEPTAAISAAKADDVLELIEDMQRRGKTILLISHRLEDVLRVCDRVAILSMGRLRYMRETAELDVGALAHLMFDHTSQAA